MGFLPSWGRKMDIGEHQRVNIPATFGPGGSLLGEYPDLYETHATHGYARNELVYACIQEKATSLPESPLRIYRDNRGDGSPDEEHPLRQLIANPNPLMSEFDLWELTVVHLELSGNAFWHIIRGRNGKPAQLWPIRPDMIRIYPSADRQKGPSYGIEFAPGKVYQAGRDVVHFKYPNPLDDYLGQAPLRPAIRAVVMDNQATDFVRALLKNHAIPGVVVETQQAIDQEVADMLKKRWMESYGGSRRGEPAFLQTGMSVKPLGLNLKELEFPDLRTISETRICTVFGVPPILVGAKAGLDRSTFANYAEARRSFWEETILPLQRRLRDTVVRKLLPEFQGPRPRSVHVAFDISDVLALKESEQAKWERATQALRAGGITVNSFLRLVGEPETGAAGEVFLRPAGVLPVDASTGKPLAAYDPGTGPSNSDGDTEESDDDDGTE